MIRALAIFSAISWLTLIAGVFLYRFEGEVFPVTSLAEITYSDIRIHPTKEGWSLISGNFEKYRNCVFIGLQWNFIASENLDVLLVGIPSEFEGPPIHRTAGKHTFDLLAVKLRDQHDILNDSLVYVYHDCYNGWLWHTRSVFYKPLAY